MLKFNNSIFFTICSFFYISLIFVVFFKKNKVKNYDNKIFVCLVLINFLSIIFELLLCIFASFYDSVLYFYINKFYLIFLLSWSVFFLLYTFNISLLNKDRYLKFRNLVLGFYVIIAFLVFICKCYYKISDGYMLYSYGLAIDVLYYSIFLCIFFIIYCLIINYKQLKNKKYLPIFMFFLVGIIDTIIQRLCPSLLLTCSVETFITVLMYFTMENPDIKLIEEIRDAKILADNANSEKSIFLYNTTQEIKNVVNDINTQVVVIENSDDLVECKDSAREINDITTKLLSMNNGIFDTSNLDDKHIKVYTDKYDVKMFLRELVSIYKGKFMEKNISFRTSFDNSIPDFLYGDVYRLKEVLLTILDNSLEYTSSGFTEFKVNTIIKYDVCRLVFEIEDSGVGMTVNEIEEVLGREEKDINKRCLANCKSILNVIGGTIILSSDYGKGTKVTIIIDQKICKSSDEKKDIINEYSKKYISKKVLLVDDSEVGLKIADKVFGHVDINFYVANSGKECLDKIRNKEKFDLIFVDELMDYMNGFEVMRKLKRINDFNTKVILMTSNNNVLYDKEYLKDGFTDYILKPLTKDKVNNLLDKYLN